GTPKQILSNLRQFIGRSVGPHIRYVWMAPRRDRDELEAQPSFSSLDESQVAQLARVSLRAGTPWYAAGVLGDWQLFHDPRDVLSALVEFSREPRSSVARLSEGSSTLFVPVRSGASHSGLCLVCSDERFDEASIAFWRLVGIIIAQIDAATQLNRNRMLMDVAFDMLAQPVLLMDESGAIVRGNHAASAGLAGLAHSRIEGRRLDALMRDWEFSPDLEGLFDRGGQWSGTVGVPRPDGSTARIPAVARSVFDADGVYLGTVAVGTREGSGSSGLDAPSVYLTARESQIAQLVAEGHSTKEIAKLLSVSPRTVQFHRHRLRVKLGIDGRRVPLRMAVLELSSRSSLN
ncbi:MAG: helix-turn-helix transcriptional regulator, partial [Spirochaetota bacterium]